MLTSRSSPQEHQGLGHVVKQILSQVVAERELSAVLQEITRESTRLTGSDNSVMFLWDPVRRETRYVSVYNAPVELLNFRLKAEESIGNLTIQQRRPVIVDDYSQHPRRIPLWEGYNLKAVLSVPILWQDEPLGALNVHSSQANRRYGSKDVEILTAMAHLAAAAVVVHRHSRQVADLAQGWDVFSQVHAASKKEIAVEEYVREVTQAVKRLFPGAQAALFYQHPVTGALEYQSSDPLTPNQVAALHRFHREARRHGQERPQQLLVPEGDGAVEARGYLIEAPRKEQLNAVTTLPLNGPAGLIGWLALYHCGQWEWEGARMIALEMLTAYLGNCLSHLLNGTGRQGRSKREAEDSQRLREFLAALPGIAMAEQPEAALLRAVLELVEGEAGLFLRWEGDGFRLTAAANLPGDLLASLGHVTPGQTWAEIWYNQRVFSVDQFGSDPQDALFCALRAHGMTGGMFGPVLADNAPYGLVVILHSQGGRFTAREKLLVSSSLETMGRALAAAADRQRLQAEQKQVAADLRAARQELEHRQRLSKLSESLAAVVEAGEDLSSLCRTLSQAVLTPVWLEDQEGHLLASYHSLLREEPAITPTARLVEQATQHGDHVLALPDRLAATLTFRGRRLGYLTLLRPHLPLFPYADVLNAARPFFAAALAQKELVLETEIRTRGDFFLELLTGDEAPEEELVYRSTQLGLRIEPPYRVVLVDAIPDPRGSAAEPPGGRVHLFRGVRGMIAPGSLVSLTPEGVALVLSGPRGERGEIQRLFEQWKPVLPPRWFAGASRALPALSALKEAYAEARRSVTAARSSRMPGRMIFFEDMDLFDLFIHTADRHLLDRMVEKTLGPLIQYDSSHSSDLVLTLQVYLQQAGHLEKTAKALFIHKNSLKYRLRRIEEILGVELGDPETQLNLHLGLKYVAALSWASTQEGAGGLARA